MQIIVILNFSAVSVIDLAEEFGILGLINKIEQFESSEEVSGY